MDLTKRSELSKQIAATFNPNELESICKSINVNYDFLSGGSDIRRKTIELIMYLERRQRLEELVAHLKSVKPEISWGE